MNENESSKTKVPLNVKVPASLRKDYEKLAEMDGDTLTDVVILALKVAKAEIERRKRFMVSGFQFQTMA